MNIILMVNLLTDLVTQDSAVRERARSAAGAERADAAKEQGTEGEAAGTKTRPQ